MPYSARWYTLLHAGNPGDLLFYMDVCNGAKSVLELGSGSGRITVPLLEMGLHVTAVDNSRVMLDALKDVASRLSPESQTRLSIVEGDMSKLLFEQQFDRIIIPYNSLLCLLSHEDVVACLKRCATHLSNEGMLVFDVYDVPMPDGDENDVFDEEHIATIEDGDQRAHVYECPIDHDDSRRFDVRYRYQIVDTDNQVLEQFEYSIAQRCLYKEELASLLDEAGLALCRLLGDFEEGPIHDETYQLAVIARKKVNKVG